MKPFITPEIMPSGKKVFTYQCEGVECKGLWTRLKGQQLIAYVLPEAHTLQTAWELSFVFGSGFVLEFSSACTQVGDWQEVGSLNICVPHRPPDVFATTEKNEIKIPAIDMVAAEKLIYEDDDVIVECGLLLRGRHGQEVVVAAGIPPGSVSVRAPFSAGQPFEPQFPIATCRCEHL
ncbi:hypothetical protein GCM10023165_54130 [Variovorax defluvii]|uniref:Uncharacterized protein n=1 Tax=Variovorax defluvii TaxID=913761 RepID=A0ABP8IHH1_9BURK